MTVVYVVCRGDAFEFNGKGVVPYRCAIPLTDPRPTATACRSRRGEAPEGSSLFRPGVEARSAEDPGKEDPERDIRPRQGVALVRESSNQCDTLAGSRALEGSVGNPESSGLRPSTSGLKNEHPCRGATQPGDPHPWGYGVAQVYRCHDGRCIGPYSSR